MKILKAILFSVFLLQSSIAYSFVSEICERTGKIGKHKESGGYVDLTIQDRLDIARLEKANLEKLLNKIPKVKPDIEKWIKEELDSGDFLRELNLGKYDEYHQYINIRNLNEMIGVLMHLEILTQEIIEVNSDAYTKIQFSTWIYYISLINNYGTLQSLAKLYERQIIFPPQDWQMIGDIANCMLKTKEMTFQLLGQYAEDNNL